jgi:hypothetical protein
MSRVDTIGVAARANARHNRVTILVDGCDKINAEAAVPG